MFNADVTCPVMPSPKQDKPESAEEPKVQFSVTLSASNARALREISKTAEGRPAISRLIDDAVSEYLRTRKSAKPSRKS